MTIAGVGGGRVGDEAKGVKGEEWGGVGVKATIAETTQTFTKMLTLLGLVII